jgi:hypothetical protein
VHIVEEGLAVMDTLTGNAGLTVMLTELEVAGFPVAHKAFEVRTHKTTSPLTKPEFE